MRRFRRELKTLWDPPEPAMRMGADRPLPSFPTRPKPVAVLCLLGRVVADILVGLHRNRTTRAESLTIRFSRNGSAGRIRSPSNPVKEREMFRRRAMARHSSQGKATQDVTATGESFALDQRIWRSYGAWAYAGARGGRTP